MRVLQDLHTHSCFCDGKHSPEEMVLSAVEKGLSCIGLCAHSYLPFDPESCMPRERYDEFRAEAARLKKKYRDRIRILCGIEQDILCREPTEDFDYVIGSVHYLEVDGEYFCVDESARQFTEGCRKFFGGDYMLLAERYFQEVSEVAEKTGCNIIAHFDLLTKFNEGGVLFNESDGAYVRAWKKAVDRLLPFGIPFEINSGAVSRGYRKMPYPAKPIGDYIRENGGKLVLSSDAHSRDAVAFRFDEFSELYEL